MEKFKPISTSVITNKGLTKHVYEFKCSHTTLIYDSYHCYNRNSKTDVWPDQWSDPKNFKEWCIENNLQKEYEIGDYDEDGWNCDSESYHHEYEKYCDTFNPCMVKTNDGRTCGYGESGYRLSHNHPITESIKEKAKKIFIKRLTVKGVKL